MYKSWYNDQTVKKKIGILKVRVHYKRNYENAFWNGHYITFGDGYRKFYPLAGLDIVAHEISHGFTQKTSGLEYRGQSGGINEAFSDMAGEASEYFANKKNDWKVGYDIYKASRKALRYMYHPELDGKSIGHARKYRSGLNVHYSSGVYNKAFYLLSKKRGWGIKKAFGIFVRANKLYWNARTDYYKGACGVISSAKDLGYSTKDVTAAFAAVGVTCKGSVPSCSPQPLPNPPSYCRGRSVSASKTGMSAAAPRCYSFYWTLPSNVCFLAVRLSVTRGYNPGNADLYVKYGSRASQRSHNYRSVLSTSCEKIVISRPRSGRWYFAVCAKQSYQKINFYGRYTLTSSTGGQYCSPQPLPSPPSYCRGRSVSASKTGMSAAAPRCYSFYWTLPSNVCFLAVRLSVTRGYNPGNADLYVKYGSRASQRYHNYRSVVSTSCEKIVISRPRSGRWYFAVCAKQSYQKINFYGRYTLTSSTGGQYCRPQPLPSPPSYCRGRSVAASKNGMTASAPRCYSISWNIPSNACYLAVRLSVTRGYNPGNADLYVKYGSQASQRSHNYRSSRSNSCERILISRPRSGRWYFAICARQSYQKINFYGRYTVSSTVGQYCSPQPLPSPPSYCRGRSVSTSKTGMSAAAPRCYSFYWTLPSNVCFLAVRLSVTRGYNPGNADLYVKYGSRASQRYHNYRSVVSTSCEKIVISRPRSGRWYFAVCAKQSYQKINFYGRYTLTSSTGGQYCSPQPLPRLPYYCRGRSHSVSKYGMTASAPRCYSIYWNIPSNVCYLAVRLSVTRGYNPGNADLYVKYGSQASQRSHNYRSTRTDSCERILISRPRSGRWYFAICARQSYQKINFYGRYTLSSNVHQYCSPQPLPRPYYCRGTSRSVSKYGMTASAPRCYSIYWNIPSNVCYLAVRLSVTRGYNPGNADLYVKYGSRASQRSYNYRSSRTNSCERILISRPRSGRWYFAICARQSYQRINFYGRYTLLRRRLTGDDNNGTDDSTLDINNENGIEVVDTNDSSATNNDISIGQQANGNDIGDLGVTNAISTGTENDNDITNINPENENEGSNDGSVDSDTSNELGIINLGTDDGDNSTNINGNEEEGDSRNDIDELEQNSEETNAENVNEGDVKEGSNEDSFESGSSNTMGTINLGTGEGDGGNIATIGGNEIEDISDNTVDLVSRHSDETNTETFDGRDDDAMGDIVDMNNDDTENGFEMNSNDVIDLESNAYSTGNETKVESTYNWDGFTNVNNEVESELEDNDMIESVSDYSEESTLINIEDDNDENAVEDIKNEKHVLDKSMEDLSKESNYQYDTNDKMISETNDDSATDQKEIGSQITTKDGNLGGNDEDSIANDKVKKQQAHADTLKEKISKEERELLINALEKALKRRTGNEKANTGN